MKTVHAGRKAMWHCRKGKGVRLEKMQSGWQGVGKKNLYVEYKEKNISHRR